MRLFSMPSEQLPTVGLAEAYLGSTPIRESNQCAIAALVVQLAMRTLGLDPEPVALELDVPNGRRGTTRYGNPNPRLVNGQVIGHVGLIADGVFLDITGAQFPEIAAHGGVRVIAGSLGSQSHEVLRTGANMPVRLADGYEVAYRVYPEGSADSALIPLIELNRQALPQLANNLILIFTKMLTAPPLLDKVSTLSQPRYATLVHRVLGMQGRELTTTTDGTIVVV